MQLRRRQSSVHVIPKEESEDEYGKEGSTSGDDMARENEASGIEYVVEQIEDVRIVRGEVVEVYIRWEGYSEDHSGWETIEALNAPVDTYNLSEKAKLKLTRCRGKKSTKGGRSSAAKEDPSCSSTPIPSRTLIGKPTNTRPSKGLKSVGEAMNADEVDFPQFPLFNAPVKKKVHRNLKGAENAGPSGLPRRSPRHANRASSSGGHKSTSRSSNKRAPPAPWECNAPPKKKGKSESRHKVETPQPPERVNLLSSDDEGRLVNVSKDPDLSELKPWQLYNPPYPSDGDVWMDDCNPDVPCLEAPPEGGNPAEAQENPSPSLPPNETQRLSLEERVEAILQPFQDSGDVLFREKKYAEADRKYAEGLKKVGNGVSLELVKVMVCRRAAAQMQLGHYKQAVKMFEDKFWEGYESHRWLLMQALWLICEEDDGVRKIIKHAKAIRSGLKKHVDMLDPFCVPSSDILEKIKTSLEHALERKMAANTHFRNQEFLLAAQKYKEAIEFEEKAEGCAPIRFVAILYSNLGQAHYCLQRYYDGILSWCRAQVVDPSFLKSTHRLANCLHELHYNKAALDVCRTTQAEVPVAVTDAALRDKINSIASEENTPTPDPQKLLDLKMPVFNSEEWKTRRKAVWKDTHPDKQKGFTDKINRSLCGRLLVVDEELCPSVEKSAFDKRAAKYFTWCFNVFNDIIKTENAWKTHMTAHIQSVGRRSGWSGKSSKNHRG